MHKLEAEVSACLDLVKEGGVASAQLPEIKRIQGSCALLGLKHCANLLRLQPEDGPSLDETGLVSLREVKLQVSLALEFAMQEA
jgi:hypothetical protein